MSLIAKNISLQIGNKVLLEDINFAVHPCELVAIVGPNGAGKSSLFKVLTREYAFFNGTVELNGRAYTEWRPEQIALQMGVLPQSSGLNFPFSAYEVVLLGRLPHSSGRIRDQEIALHALQLVDAEHLSNTSYLSLSGGEKQRVQLARVLAQIWEETPAFTERYLLLDEPTSALDLSHQHMILNQAKTMSQQGVGVVAILHDLNLAAEYADRIVMLKEGKVHTEGAIETSLQPPLIEQLFDIKVDVIKHPQSGKPLVISSGYYS